eukprot:GHVL01043535.1.p1 GENE.GHVL01043535.1~~GHVL01043535.1.p1  ORF type:complete len:411 (-),score=30.57 GHVL01043535.1:250-1482(-)
MLLWRIHTNLVYQLDVPLSIRFTRRHQNDATKTSNNSTQFSNNLKRRKWGVSGTKQYETNPPDKYLKYDEHGNMYYAKSTRTVKGRGEEATAGRYGVSNGSVVEEPLGSDAPRWLRQHRVAGDWNAKWRNDVSHQVPYKFRVTEHVQNHDQHFPLSRDTSTSKEYVDFIGNRYPVLETAENFRYWKDKGLDRLIPRVFPMHLPTERRIDPFLREFIHFLHKSDPARFTKRRIGERYGLKESTVEKIVYQFEKKMWLREQVSVAPRYKFFLKNLKTSVKLTSFKGVPYVLKPYVKHLMKARFGNDLMTQKPREEKVLDQKEYFFSKKCGYDQLGDDALDSEEDADPEAFKGYRSTSDWVHKQYIQVESMTAYPLMELKNPVPKRVDVDVTVKQDDTCRIMNWIDPRDKIVF